MPVGRNYPYRNASEHAGAEVTNDLSRRLDSLGTTSPAPGAGVIVRAVRAKRIRSITIKIVIVLALVILAVAIIVPKFLVRTPLPAGVTPTGGNTPSSLLDDGPTFGSTRSIQTPEGTAALEPQKVKRQDEPLRLIDVVPVTSNENAAELTSPKR